jgi:hopanoid biosynthesis associated radical SAM protein HpnH
MRFPFSLTRSMTGYLLKKRFARVAHFPFILMLEPLHACNLHCSGCGRVREYAETVSKRLSVNECLAAVDECGAPVVSVCGGEPLIYDEIGELVGRIIDRGKHVYLCTNGVKLLEKLDAFAPSSKLFINVHIDGLELAHDAIVGRPGVFQKAVEGVQGAVKRGFQVCTNTTLYHQTDLEEVVQLFDYLSSLGVGGLMLSPSYGYEAVCEEASDEIFMTRSEIHEKFKKIRGRLSRYPMVTSPVYFDFLCGERDLECAAWANPTYNVCGWKGPCYLMTDRHYPTYQQLIDETDWESLGPGQDRRCQDCLVHCGFEPAAVLAAGRSVRDTARMALWHFRG